MSNLPLERNFRSLSVNGVDAHPTEDAIVVTYNLEASLVADLGHTLLNESKECQKIIRLKSLKETNDYDVLAATVIKKSNNLISEAQFDEVKRILIYLKSRNEPSNETAGKMENLRPKTASSIRSSKSSDDMLSNSNGSKHAETRREFLSQEFFDDLKGNHGIDLSKFSNATINNLDDFMEKLYDDVKHKMIASGIIFKLSLNPDNLDELTSNEPLLCILSRILREDSKKSIELTSIITAFFASIAEYTAFHPVIIQYKIGSLCLDIIASELDKDDEVYKQLNDGHAGNGKYKKSELMSTSETPSVKKYLKQVRKQNELLNTCFTILFFMSEDKKIEHKMVNKHIIHSLILTLERSYDYDNSSDINLLILSVTFLRNLSIYHENTEQFVEHELVAITFDVLCRMTSNHNMNLHLTHSTFGLLLNMSFDPTLKQQMIEAGFVPKLIILWTKSDRLNSNRKIEQLLLQLLYQMTRGCDKTFLHKYFNTKIDITSSSSTETMDLIMLKFNRTIAGDNNSRRLLTARTRGAFKSNCVMEMMALLINLSLDAVLARKMTSNNRLNVMMDVVYKKGGADSIEVNLQNVLLLKIIRNITSHDYDGSDAIKNTVVTYVDTICLHVFQETKDGHLNPSKPVKKTSPRHQGNKNESEKEELIEEDLKESFSIESIGILSNLMNLPKETLNWNELFTKYNIFEEISSKLKTGSCSEDDLILELIMFLSAVSCQKEISLSMMSKGILAILSDVISFKQEDDEIVLQVIFTIHVLCRHKELRNKIAVDEKIPEFLIDLMDDKNPVINNLCKVTLEILSECNEDLFNRFKANKFRIHNSQWLEIADGQQQISLRSSDVSSREYDEDEDDEDDEIEYDDEEEDEESHYTTAASFSHRHPNQLSLMNDHQEISLNKNQTSIDSLEPSNSSSTSVSSTPPAVGLAQHNVHLRPETAFGSRAPSARPHTGYKRRPVNWTVT